MAKNINEAYQKSGFERKFLTGDIGSGMVTVFIRLS